LNALTEIHETEGLDVYLEEIEQRLLAAVGRHPGLASTVGAEALAAGGKRLRPLLVFLAAPADHEPPYAAGVRRPSNPSSPMCRQASHGNSPLRSHSRERGASSLRAKARSVRVRSSCSGVKSRCIVRRP
jgi:hypothetical protein